MFFFFTKILYILLIVFFLLLWWNNTNNQISLFSSICANFLFLKSNLFSINYSSINIIFLLTVFIITFFSFSFSAIYMQFETRKESFFVLLNLFMLSMVGFLLSDFWVTFLFFWECLGITSFFLINFYQTKLTTLKSSLKAFCFNRVSDSFFFLLLLKLSLLNSTLSMISPIFFQEQS